MGKAAMIRTARRLLRPLKRAVNQARSFMANAYLSSCSGVIHVGANAGQERDLYAAHGLAVVWIEPIPSVFAKLCDNIRHYPTQRAINALIMERDGAEHVLHIANNEGASSSVFDLHLHRDIWPEVAYVDAIAMRSSTLPSALQAADIELSGLDALILDTQGSELSVLKGATPILGQFRYVQVEAADFEAYRDGALAADIVAFMHGQGFALKRKQRTARHHAGGRYYELLFKNRTR